MKPSQQVAQVNHFMCAIAPVITSHSMTMIHSKSDLRQLAASNAELTLQFAMHLASQFAAFHDEALKATHSKNPVKAEFAADEQMQREAAPAGSGL